MYFQLHAHLPAAHAKSNQKGGSRAKYCCSKAREFKEKGAVTKRTGGFLWLLVIGLTELI